MDDVSRRACFGLATVKKQNPTQTVTVQPYLNYDLIFQREFTRMSE